ncbi:putative ribonuclease H-like domain-containing protein [Tanacetum coccineum]
MISGRDGKWNIYLEYIDNEVWKVIQKGKLEVASHTPDPPPSRRLLVARSVSTKGKGIGCFQSGYLHPTTLAEQESLEKGYDRFQKLLSQLDALGASVSDEDANHKFLRSLPPAWDSLAMTMRTKKNIDTLSIDDLYNNLSVFEQDIQKTSSSSLTSDKFGRDGLLNWMIAMTAIKIKKFYKKTGRRPRVDGKMHVAFDKRKVECFNCHNTGHFARECKFKSTKDGSRQEASRGQDFKPVRTEKEALMTIDEEHSKIAALTATNTDRSNTSSIVFSICPSNDRNEELGAVSDASSTHYSTCQSNDSDGEQGTDHPLKHMEHRGIFDSGCSGHMTGNRAHLEDYQELSKVGSVTFGGSKGSISGKGTIRLGNLVFDDVAFVKMTWSFNLFSISQICDKKLNVLFTEKECFVVSSDFKMPDENQVLLKVPRQHNMYTFDMKNVDSSQGYTCLLAKASSNEAKLWHRRLGHLNFKNLNKLVKDNLVRGLPSKSFKNDHTCVACQKGKQHKASCKAKIDRYVTHPLHTLHMDLFGPTSVRSINHASYCLVITDDCSRFCWVFFLAKKDETSGILKTFVRQIENQLNQKVKIIRSDNGTEFKNRVMLEFLWGNKGIKRSLVIAKNSSAKLSSNTVVITSNRLKRLKNSLWFLLLLEKQLILNTCCKDSGHYSKKPSSTPISKSADDIMVFRKELDALALKHLGPVPTTVPTSTNPVNTGSSNLNTAFEEVNTGHMEAVSPSAQNEEEVFSDDNEDEMPEIRIYDKSSQGIFEQASYDDDGVITNFNNLSCLIEYPKHFVMIARIWM